jgi:hypothetical protein
MVIVDWFYDKAVRGADAITDRPGFAAMLDRIAGNGVRAIIVESPDRALIGRWPRRSRSEIRPPPDDVSQSQLPARSLFGSLVAPSAMS